MGYEDEMQEYHSEQMVSAEMKYRITYKVNNGVYYANSIFGLVWEVFTHRLWHLFTHGRWVD